VEGILAMKWSAVICVVMLAGVASARADGLVQERYRDLIRPHGHPRSDAIHQADLDYCYNETGDIRAFADTPAFKKCMLARGYRWQSTHFSGNFPGVPMPGPFDSGCPAFCPQ
jgi:hypothetical protein